MKKNDFDFYGVQELNSIEMKETGGGWILAFIAGALVGGVIYEVAREVWTTAVEVYIEESKKGTYEGMPSPSFRH